MQWSTVSNYLKYVTTHRTFHETKLYSLPHVRCWLLYAENRGRQEPQCSVDSWRLWFHHVATASISHVRTIYACSSRADPVSYRNSAERNHRQKHFLNTRNATLLSRDCSNHIRTRLLYPVMSKISSGTATLSVYHLSKMVPTTYFAEQQLMTSDICDAKAQSSYSKSITFRIHPLSIIYASQNLWSSPPGSLAVELARAQCYGCSWTLLAVAPYTEAFQFFLHPPYRNHCQ